MNWWILVLGVMGLGFIIWVIVAGRKECIRMNNKRKK